ncbi:MAG: SCO family protein [Candidatus Marinamargulisbacteria bacterium]|nr:SCO family protein [Candidatus Marinamargulisbacteria bacterium]|tara:strand:+ start:2506 stop:3225 length:720 start_codon:yes stop_codon:yes gene_type:complete
MPDAIKTVGVTEKVGQLIPQQPSFTNSRGYTAPLSEHMVADKPILLNFVYFNCPMLCHLILDGLQQSLEKMDTKTLKGMQVISMSFDPRDKYNHAAKFEARYRETVDPILDWSFLVGEADAIQQVTDASGFYYRYDETINEYAHGSVLVAISPDGKIQRYIYGIEYDPFDLKMALLETNPTNSKSLVEGFLLFCYTYDSSANSYVLQAQQIMKLGAGFVAIVLMGLIVYLGLSNRRNRV